MNLIPWRRKRERESHRFEPTTALERFRQEVDALWNSFFGGPWLAGREGPALGPARLPRTDVAETERELTVTMELPGVDPQDVQIEVAGGMLTVQGEKRREKVEKQKNYHFVERCYGSFHRTVPLPSFVDADQVDAAYKNGVLTIRIPKMAAAQPKRITVKSP